MKLPLIARAAIGIGLATLAASTLAMLSVRSIQRSDLHKEMLARGDAAIRQFAMATAPAILVEDAAVLGEIARNLVASEPDIDQVEVRNEEGVILATAGEPGAETRVDHMVREEFIEVAGERFGSVRIAWNLQERLAAIRSTSRQIAGVIGLLLVVTGGLALSILHRIAIRPRSSASTPPWISSPKNSAAARNSNCSCVRGKRWKRWAVSQGASPTISTIR